jgi:hypothetical protein
MAERLRGEERYLFLSPFGKSVFAIGNLPVSQQPWGPSIGESSFRFSPLQ